MRRILSLAVLGVSALPGVDAFAMTWAEARAAAAARAPEVEVALRRSEAAAADVHVAGALANPTFTVTTARLTARLSAGVSVPMPLFGQRGLAVDAARAEADAAVEDAGAVRNELRWGATRAWIDAWEAGERAHLVAVGAKDAARLSSIADERFAAGLAPRLDVVRAGADRARAEADAAASGPLVAAAAARLAAWVGADPTAALAIDGAPGVPETLPALGDLVAAVAGHPFLRRDRAHERAAGHRIDLERRLRFPIVSAELVVNQGDPTLKDAGGRQQTDVIGGAAFELPVVNQRGGAIARARADHDLAAAAMALDAAHLRADLVDAYRRTEAAASRARAIAGRALPATEEARAMTEDSYRAGRSDLVRVLEAERAVRELRLEQVDAIATWARSFADIERAAGHWTNGAGGDDAGH